MPLEQKYNPQDFARMSLDQNHFRARMPLIVPKIVDTFNLDLPTRQIESQPIEQMLGNMKTLWDKGSEMLLYWVYGEYGRNNGLTADKTVEWFGKEMIMKNTVLNLDELKAEDLAKWKDYMTRGNIPREIAVGAFYMNFGFMMPSSLPSIRYMEDERVRALYHVVASVPYKVVATVFPDLTDDESKKLFGQLTPAADVFRKAEVSSVSGELMPPSIT